MIHPALDRWARGWRGPWLAALIALIAGLPGVLAMPPLDRDESRFAQASAQMLESGDIVAINFQNEPRDKKPVGIYWLQAAAVDLVSSPAAREIWAYRLPSLMGAMIAAAALTWGASAFLGAGRGLIAGVLLGACFLLSTEASIAKTDAVLCASTTLMMAAFSRIYGAARGEGQAGRGTRLVFWAAMAVGALVKGPVTPLVAIFAGAVLWVWDRRASWLRRMDWGWGLVILAAIVGPWALAITVSTDGAFWGAAVGGDLAPKLVSGDESHGGPAGLHLLLSPILFFPASLLLPAGLVWAWRRRSEAGTRFAIAWLAPTWLMFELLPTKLPHYTLPAYGALAWLAAAALGEPLGKWVKRSGAAILVFAATILSAATVYLAREYADRTDMVAAGLCLLLFFGCAGAGAWGLLRDDRRGLMAALVLGLLAHGAAVGLFVPRLEPLWLSPRVARALQGEGLDPRNGVTPGPVAVAGYGEPSLVFLLGTRTALTDAAGAAAAIGEGRPAVVEGRVDGDFRAALKGLGLTARPVAIVRGVNYSDGDDEQLVIYHASLQPVRR